MEQIDPLGAFFAKAKAQRIPMSEVCRRAGVDPTTPSRWKRKRNGANVDTIRRLAGALDAIIAEQPAPTKPTPQSAVA